MSKFCFKCGTELRSEYILKVLDKHTGNDFMNIEKANTNFKKAFEIDVKKLQKKTFGMI